MADGFNINYEPGDNMLTGKTWGDYAERGLHPGERVGWAVEADLARQLWKMPGHDHLRYQEWSLLLSAATTALPVVITWDTTLNMNGGRKIERKTRTVIVQQASAPNLTRPSELPVSLRVAYSGFGHRLAATDIREVAPPPALSAVFLDPADCAYVRMNP